MSASAKTRFGFKIRPNVNPAVTPRASISGKAISDRDLSKIIEAKKMLTRKPINVGAGIALPPSSSCFNEAVASSTLARRQAYVAENIPSVKKRTSIPRPSACAVEPVASTSRGPRTSIPRPLPPSICAMEPAPLSTFARRQAYAAEKTPSVKMRDPRTVQPAPTPLVGSAYEKRLEYEAPKGIAVTPQGKMFVDPVYQAYEKKVLELAKACKGRYRDLTRQYKNIQDSYKKKHKATPPRIPRVDVLLDVERKKFELQSTSAAAKRLSYAPSIPKEAKVAYRPRPPKVVQPPLEKRPSAVDIRKQYAASIARKPKTPMPCATPAQRVDLGDAELNTMLRTLRKKLHAPSTKKAAEINLSLKELQSNYEENLQRIEDTIECAEGDPDTIKELELEKEFLEMELDVQKNAIIDGSYAAGAGALAKGKKRVARKLSFTPHIPKQTKASHQTPRPPLEKRPSAADLRKQYAASIAKKPKTPVPCATPAQRVDLGDAELNTMLTTLRKKLHAPSAKKTTNINTSLQELQSNYAKDLQRIEDTIECAEGDPDTIKELEMEKEFLEMEHEVQKNAILDGSYAAGSVAKGKKPVARKLSFTPKPLALDDVDEEPQTSALERRKQFAQQIRPPSLPTQPRRPPEKQKSIRDIHKEFEENRINLLIEDIRKGTPFPKAKTVSVAESQPSLSALERRKQYASKTPTTTQATPKTPRPSRAPSVESQTKVPPEKTALEKRKEFASKIKPPSQFRSKSVQEKPKTIRDIQKEYEAKRRQQMLEEEAAKEVVRKSMAEDGENTDDILGSVKEPTKPGLRPPRLKPLTLDCKPSAAEIRRKYELERREMLAQTPSKESVCSAKRKKKPGELKKPPDDPKEKARKMKEYEEKRREEIKLRKAEVAKAVTEGRQKLASQSLPLPSIPSSEDIRRKRKAQRVRACFAAPRGSKLARERLSLSPIEECSPAQGDDLGDAELNAMLKTLRSTYKKDGQQVVAPRVSEVDCASEDNILLKELESKYEKDLERIEDTIESAKGDPDTINDLEMEKEFLEMELDVHKNAVLELPKAKMKALDTYHTKFEALEKAGGNDILKDSLHNEYKQKIVDLVTEAGLPKSFAYVTPKRHIVVSMEQLSESIKEKSLERQKTVAKKAPPTKKVPPKKIKSFTAIEEEKKQAAVAEKKRIQENLTKMLAKQKDARKTLQSVRKKPKDPRPDALFAPQEADALQMKAQEDLQIQVNTRLARTKTDPITQSTLAREQADDIFKELMIQHAGGDFTKDPAELRGLLVPNVAPKLPLIGVAAEGDINEGVLTKQIPTAEINALNTIVNEEIGINISITEQLPIPATNVAQAAVSRPEDFVLDFSTRNPPTKEHHEVAVTLDSFYVENHFQARGSAWPKWFPGYYTAFPGENTNVILQKSPSDVLYKAWEMLKPPYVDPNCAEAAGVCT